MSNFSANQSKVTGNVDLSANESRICAPSALIGWNFFLKNWNPCFWTPRMTRAHYPHILMQEHQYNNHVEDGLAPLLGKKVYKRRFSSVQFLFVISFTLIKINFLWENENNLFLSRTKIQHSIILFIDYQEIWSCQK